MIAFNSKIAAGVAVFLGATYMVVALASGRSARSEAPPDLSAGAAEAGLDVWKVAAALLDDSGKPLLLDVRSAEDFGRYHLPGAQNEPGAKATRLIELARDHAPVILVAAKDDAAQKLVAEARAAKDARIHYLIDGPRAWYLAFDLPVPLFTDVAVPLGYEDALGTAKAFLLKSGAVPRRKGMEALQTLAKLNFQPTLLKQSGKPKAAGGAKKKISGGCG